MKKRSSQLLLCILITACISSYGYACQAENWNYTLSIDSLSLDMDELRGRCTKDTCVTGEYYINLRSAFDGRAGIVVSEERVSIVVPNDVDESGKPVPAGIDPGAFDWKGCAETDLKVLRDSGVLSISDEDLLDIKGLATNGKNLGYCAGEWKQLPASCMCIDGEEMCVNCAGGLVTPQIPQNSIWMGTPNSSRTLERQVEQFDTPDDTTILIRLVLLLFVIAGIIILRANRP